MARRPLNSGKMGLEVLERINGRKCHEGVQPCAVKGIYDKVGNETSTELG